MPGVRRRSVVACAALVVAGCVAHEAVREPVGSSRSPLTWGEKQKWTPSVPANGALFGTALAVDGSTAIVGASADPTINPNAGAAFVYVRSGGTWALQQKLAPGDLLANDSFGAAVAISGDTAVVGSRQHDSAANDAGAAYVYIRSGTTWTLQQKLTATDAVAGDWFGASVAIQGDRAFVGASQTHDLGNLAGSVYTFTRSGTVWTQVQELHAGDGSANAHFGNALAISGTTLAIGAYGDGAGALFAGAAYAFTFNGAQWVEQQKLTASDPAMLDQLGVSIAIDGDTLAAGCYWDDDKGGESGSVLVFGRSGTTWTLQQKLTAPDGAESDWFGLSVSLAGESLLAGAVAHDEGVIDTGAAYFFSRTGSTWSFQQKLAASDKHTNDVFGGAVALSIGFLLVGAPGGDSTIADTGAVYVFESTGQGCTSDTECPSGHCADAVCCDSACTGSCRSCAVAGSEGTCSAVLGKADPDTCTGSVSCSQTGACLAASGQGCGSDAACATGHCADGVCCDQACGMPCDVCLQSLGATSDGVCGPANAGYPGAPACAPGACDGVKTVCPVQCSDDTQCAPGLYCDASGGCAVQKAQGAACDDAASKDCLVAGCRVCASAGGCMDGFCCDSACGGSCDACASSAGASQNGTCTVLSASAPGAPDCAPFLCSGTSSACATTCTVDADCAASAYCEANACAAKRPAGESCTSAAACASGHCVDTVCCDQPCTGQCEACGEAATKGTCVPVDGAPRGDRPACAGPVGDACSARTCAGGKDRASCVGYVTGVNCSVGGCAAGVETLAAQCDGSGACPKPDTIACNPYFCDGAHCGSTCASDADCVPTSRCETGTSKCVSRSEGSCDGDHTVTNPGGGTKDCSPYRCTSPAACLFQCATAADCIEGYRCDAQSRCVQEQAASGPAQDDGCGCRAPGAAPERGRWLIGVLAAWWVARRRGGRTRRR